MGCINHKNFLPICTAQGTGPADNIRRDDNYYRFVNLSFYEWLGKDKMMFFSLLVIKLTELIERLFFFQHTRMLYKVQTYSFIEINMSRKCNSH